MMFTTRFELSGVIVTAGDTESEFFCAEKLIDSPADIDGMRFVAV